MLLLAGLWPGSLAALVLGLAIGWVGGRPTGAAIPAGLAVATLALAGTSVAGLVPGVPGFWLDSAVAMLVPYLAGCALGAFARVRAGAAERSPDNLKPARNRGAPVPRCPSRESLRLTGDTRTDPHA